MAHSQAPKESSIGILPMASAEKTPESPAKPIAPKPDMAPAKTPPLSEEAPEPVATAPTPVVAKPGAAPTENTGKMPVSLSQALPPRVSPFPAF